MVQIPPISFISSYFVNVFLCARLHVRSLSNIKAYIHHRVCVRAHACLWRTWPHYFSRGYCLFCVSLTRAERVVHKLSARKWPPQVEEPNCKWKNRTERITHGQRSAFSSRRVWFRWLTPVFRSGCDVGESVLCYSVPVMGVNQRCVFVGELIMFIAFNPK